MSILNKIKITAQLKQQRNALEALRSKQAEFDKRKAELETAIGEAKSDEDIAAVNAEVEKLQAEEKEDGLADKITEVETGIAKLEEELGNEEAQTEKEQPQQAERNKDMSEMNKYKARELFRTGEYYERAEVKDFLRKTQKLKSCIGRLTYYTRCCNLQNTRYNGRLCHTLPTCRHYKGKGRGTYTA